MLLQAEPSRVRQQLIAEGLELEEVGGSVQVVETAAPTGLGLLDLEEALMLQVTTLPFTADMQVCSYAPGYHALSTQSSTTSC